MKLYLAGPMRGYPHFNFPAFFEAARSLRDKDYIVFNPAERDVKVHGDGIANNPTGDEAQATKDHGFNLRDALEDDTTWICRHADGIALLPGWEKSKGATAERALGLALGLEVQPWWYFQMCSFGNGSESSRGSMVQPQPSSTGQGEIGETIIRYEGGTGDRTSSLIENLSSAERKKYPVGTGFLDYFRDAVLRVARVSYEGNEKHNPGQPTHWSRAKSDDHFDCLLRHSLEGNNEGHLANAAWRAMARLQMYLEARYNITPPPGAR